MKRVTEPPNAKGDRLLRDLFRMLLDVLAVVLETTVRKPVVVAPYEDALMDYEDRFVALMTELLSRD